MADLLTVTPAGYTAGIRQAIGASSGELLTRVRLTIRDLEPVAPNPVVIEADLQATTMPAGRVAFRGHDGWPTAAIAIHGNTRSAAKGITDQAASVLRARAVAHVHFGKVDKQQLANVRAEVAAAHVALASLSAQLDAAERDTWESERRDEAQANSGRRRVTAATTDATLTVLPVDDPNGIQ